MLLARDAPFHFFSFSLSFLHGLEPFVGVLVEAPDSSSFPCTFYVLGACRFQFPSDVRVLQCSPHVLLLDTTSFVLILHL